jgi:WD40 repeat protein
LSADALKPESTLGTPKKQATFGVGFLTTDSHLALSFSPDGKTLASASLDGSVRLWDVTTGKERTSFKEQSCQVWALAFSPNGKMLALGGWEKEGDKFIGAVWLRDVASGKLKETFGKQRYGTFSVAYSPDGKTLASGGDDCTVRLWDVESGGETATLLKQPHHSVMCVAFSPDGKTLAASGGSVEPMKGGTFFSVVRLLDVASGKERASLQGHRHWVSSVAFSPDNKTLASGSYDGTVRLWDATSGKQKTVFEARHKQGLILSVAFSPDARFIATGGVDGGGAKAAKGVGTVRLWDVTTGKEKTTFGPHGPFVTSVVFGPAGKTLASGSGDTTVKLWNVPAARESGAAANDAKQ